MEGIGRLVAGGWWTDGITWFITTSPNQLIQLADAAGFFLLQKRDSRAVLAAVGRMMIPPPVNCEKRYFCDFRKFGFMF